MKKKKLILAFILIAIALAGAIHVAVAYATIASDQTTSTPPQVAFLYGAPYLAAVIICFAIGMFFTHRRR